ncbi:uncharacterized protein LOC136082507 [Hydra vulgaris]|uniref:Uncharacterized protein LOC136082507 n=1 Tax=Hydra vulgaris TaxID=6087 RepID=A0ABM4C8P0_HYDVU
MWPKGVLSSLTAYQDDNSTEADDNDVVFSSRRCMVRALSQSGVYHFSCSSLPIKVKEDSDFAPPGIWSSILCDNVEENYIVNFTAQKSNASVYIEKGENVLLSLSANEELKWTISDSNQQMVSLESILLPEIGTLFHFNQTGCFRITADSNVPVKNNLICNAHVWDTIESSPCILSGEMNGGSVEVGHVVYLHCASDAAIYYTTDGTMPMVPFSMLYNKDEGVQVVKWWYILCASQELTQTGKLPSGVFTSERFYVFPPETPEPYFADTEVSYKSNIDDVIAAIEDTSLVLQTMSDQNVEDIVGDNQIVNQLEVQIKNSAENDPPTKSVENIPPVKSIEDNLPIKSIEDIPPIENVDNNLPTKIIQNDLPIDSITTVLLKSPEKFVNGEMCIEESFKEKEQKDGADNENVQSWKVQRNDLNDKRNSFLRNDYESLKTSLIEDITEGLLPTEIEKLKSQVEESSVNDIKESTEPSATNSDFGNMQSWKIRRKDLEETRKSFLKDDYEFIKMSLVEDLTAGLLPTEKEKLRLHIEENLKNEIIESEQQRCFSESKNEIDKINEDPFVQMQSWKMQRIDLNAKRNSFLTHDYELLKMCLIEDLTEGLLPYEKEKLKMHIKENLSLNHEKDSDTVDEEKKTENKERINIIEKIKIWKKQRLDLEEKRTCFLSDDYESLKKSLIEDLTEGLLPDEKKKNFVYILKKTFLFQNRVFKIQLLVNPSR